MHGQRDAFLDIIGAKPVLMGILNLTPDSFSDGGRYFNLDAAVAQALRLVADGADIIDIGAESTRPGATPVPEAEELARIEPILGAVALAITAPISIDTYKASVARRAVQLGACVVNDVWGLQKDPAMADTVAETGAAVVVMHNRAAVDPDIDIVSDMRRFFDHSLKLAARAGIPQAHIMLDPGIGFGKSQLQNLQALQGLASFADYSLPMLVGVSRKSLLGAVLDSAIDQRLIGTIATNLAARARGAQIFRVHDVAEHVAAFRMFEAIDHPESFQQPESVQQPESLQHARI